MALARHVHVVVFVVDDARRALRLLRDERRHRRGMRGLRFLPAERAAHPLRDDDDLVHVGCRADAAMTSCTSVGCCVDECTVSCAVFARIDERRLRLEIEMILPAVHEHPFEDVLRRGQSRVGVAAADVRGSPMKLCAAMASSMVRIGVSSSSRCDGLLRRERSPRATPRR